MAGHDCELGKPDLEIVIDRELPSQKNGGGCGTRTHKPEGAGFQDRCVTNYANPPHGAQVRIVPEYVAGSRIRRELLGARLHISCEILDV